MLRMSGSSYRVNHVSWWKEELPNAEEYAEANRNLACNDWKVDFVISHCAPTSVSSFISGGTYRPDALTDYFERLKTNWISAAGISGIIIQISTSAPSLSSSMKKFSG